MNALVRLVVCVVACAPLGCSASATAAQARAANAVATAANGVQGAYDAAYRADSDACVQAAESYAAGQLCFVSVDERYQPVRAARDALRIAQGAWADELEAGGKPSPATAQRVAAAWCALVAVAPPAMELPPLIVCPPADAATDAGTDATPDGGNDR